MSYGILVKDALGNTILNSDTGGFLLLDTISLDAGTPSGSREYPEVKGYTLFTQQVYGATIGGFNNRMHSVTIDYSSGIPKILWMRPGSPVATTLYIFVN